MEFECIFSHDVYPYYVLDIAFFFIPISYGTFRQRSGAPRKAQITRIFNQIRIEYKTFKNRCSMLMPPKPQNQGSLQRTSPLSSTRENFTMIKPFAQG